MVNDNCICSLLGNESMLSMLTERSQSFRASLFSRSRSQAGACGPASRDMRWKRRLSSKSYRAVCVCSRPNDPEMMRFGSSSTRLFSSAASASDAMFLKW